MSTKPPKAESGKYICRIAFSAEDMALQTEITAGAGKAFIERMRDKAWGLNSDGLIVGANITSQKVPLKTLFFNFGDRQTSRSINLLVKYFTVGLTTAEVKSFNIVVFSIEESSVRDEQVHDNAVVNNKGLWLESLRNDWIASEALIQEVFADKTA